MRNKGAKLRLFDKGGIDYCAKFGNKSDCQIVGFGLVFGLWSLVFGLWSCQGLWSLVFGLWKCQPIR
jgi:hypothetical protein